MQLGSVVVLSGGKLTGTEEAPSMGFERRLCGVTEA